MYGLKNFAGRKATSLFLDFSMKKLQNNPQEVFISLLDFGQRLNVFEPWKFEEAKKIVQNPDHKWTKMAMNLCKETDPHILKQTLLNFGYQAGLYGSKLQRKLREELGTNLPWTILFDPTSACNLKCKGCWAAEYGHQLNLSFEEMDSIVTQGKEIGTYFYLLTGGEPLVRKDDIIKLCEKHNDCGFHVFTNGTLIDRDFCQEVKGVGNISFALSLEGFENANDFRRGKGVFKKVVESMELMRDEGLLFGNAICYTDKNFKDVTSDEFLDFIIEKGAKLAWYFHYMPVGKDAAPELLLTPDHREYMLRRVREIRSADGGKPIMAIDFQNDGQFIKGCIAGGKDYLHINANGDVEPCVFIHYSSANIREVSLKEALAQPLFMAYKENQPFNENHLRPCPMLENPEVLRRLVQETGAKSTDLMEKESVEQLCGKCDCYAKEWAPRAEALWKELQEKKKVKEKIPREKRAI
ncbi:MAG: radical SAM protein [Tissierellia bacterium]|nr:radical SAM protein [Tissierellia bacterium]